MNKRVLGIAKDAFEEGTKGLSPGRPSSPVCHLLQRPKPGCCILTDGARQEAQVTVNVVPFLGSELALHLEQSLAFHILSNHIWRSPHSPVGVIMVELGDTRISTLTKQGKKLGVGFEK
jgi:hypothetical protein